MTPRPLIVRLRNWVGDVILGIPALQLLESQGFALTLVGKPWAADLMRGHGWPVHTRPGPLTDRVRQLKRLRAQARLQDPRFDRRENMLLLPHSFSAALDARLAGLKAVGYAQEARSFLMARSEPITYGGHALVSYWELACRFLRLELPAPREIGLQVHAGSQARADALIDENGLGQRFVVVCPFAGGTFEKLDKMWPDFPAFAQRLVEAGRRVLVVAGPGEEAVMRERYAGLVQLSGLRLDTYAGLLRRAGLVVSNDTGPAHLAAAIGTPVLSVLGPTKPEQWAPWGPQVEILRHWPRWPTVDEVLARTLARLA